MHIEKIRASDTGNRIIGVRRCHITSYLYHPLCMLCFGHVNAYSYILGSLSHSGTICQWVSECIARPLGWITEMEAHGLGSQAQVGRPWPAIMTARRLSAHVNLTLCHPCRRGQSSSLELAYFRKLPVNQRSPGSSHLHPGGWVTHLLATDMLSTLPMLKLFFCVQPLIRRRWLTQKPTNVSPSVEAVENSFRTLDY